MKLRASHFTLELYYLAGYAYGYNRKKIQSEQQTFLEGWEDGNADQYSNAPPVADFNASYFISMDCEIGTIITGIDNPISSLDRHVYTLGSYPDLGNIYMSAMKECLDADGNLVQKKTWETQ